ncbi:hypothetical protein C0Q70_04110 [Pomacea canaliculata]|uniref:Uncharacterized protein n=1 Tax=Pomacea canaliculata TaxID=400727 RepID=A0A2T7PUK7_POMCA|nr:hypothetical protein C0Q70_04110 [Pomacea canaliculata]
MSFEDDFIVSESSNDSVSPIQVRTPFEDKSVELDIGTDSDDGFQPVVSRNRGRKLLHRSFNSERQGNVPELRFPIVISTVQRENRAVVLAGPVKLTREVKAKIGEVVEIRPHAQTNKLIIGCSSKLQQEEATNIKHFLGFPVLCYQPGHNLPVKIDRKRGLGVVRNIPIEESLEDLNQLLGPNINSFLRNANVTIVTGLAISRINANLRLSVADAVKSMIQDRAHFRSIKISHASIVAPPAIALGMEAALAGLYISKLAKSVLLVNCPTGMLCFRPKLITGGSMPQRSLRTSRKFRFLLLYRPPRLLPPYRNWFSSLSL